MNEVFNIEFQDRQIEVIASFDIGETGDYWTPSIPEGYFADKIFYKGREITNLLSKDSFDEIFEIINE